VNVCRNCSILLILFFAFLFLCRLTQVDEGLKFTQAGFMSVKLSAATHAILPSPIILCINSQPVTASSDACSDAATYAIAYAAREVVPGDILSIQIDTPSLVKKDMLSRVLVQWWPGLTDSLEFASWTVQADVRCSLSFLFALLVLYLYCAGFVAVFFVL
jgi:hypothetical protein